MKKGENYKTKRIEPPIIESDDDEDKTPFANRRMSFTLGTHRPDAIDFKNIAAKDDISETGAAKKQGIIDEVMQGPSAILKKIANKVKFDRSLDKGRRSMN